jgi:hypothetical protein
VTGHRDTVVKREFTTLQQSIIILQQSIIIPTWYITHEIIEEPSRRPQAFYPFGEQVKLGTSKGGLDHEDGTRIFYVLHGPFRPRYGV